jgi:hypothetical protein
MGRTMRPTHIRILAITSKHGRLGWGEIRAPSGTENGRLLALNRQRQNLRSFSEFTAIATPAIRVHPIALIALRARRRRRQSPEAEISDR